MTDTAARVLYNASLAREGHGPVDDIEWEQVWTSYREIPESRIDKIMQDIAALTEAGMTIVPVEATEKRLRAGMRAIDFDGTHYGDREAMREAYKAMIGAGK